MPLPEFWSRRWVGDTLLVLFLLTQVLDGAFTYVGILTLGAAIEWNPLLAWWMRELGVGPALAGAKIVAGSCGIALHVTRVHHAIAILTALYVALAIVPWTSILFLMY